MVTSFRESPAKRVVRERWDTPLLMYLHREYGVRYRYMGFPGTALTDVRLWKDMLDEVVAFERPAPTGDPRGWITELRTNLMLLGVRSITYYGSFEEVVVLRRDLDGQAYNQDKIITLYNLDFCDEIGSRVPTPEGDRVWRFEALRTIVEDQSLCYRRGGEPAYFILLLTIRNQIGAKQIRSFLRPSGLLAETEAYRRSCERVRRLPQTGNLIGRHAWSLKAFLYNTLRNYFGTPNISALFFPLAKYAGTPVSRAVPSPMLHWMILCRFGEREDAGPKFFPQDYLAGVVSLETNGSGMRLSAEPGERPNPGQPLQVVDWFLANRPSSFDFGAPVKKH